MNQQRIASRATVVTETGNPAYIGPPFHIVGTSDMNADSKADIVWYNDNTGETQIWFMNQQRIASRATVVTETGNPAYIGPPWRIVGTADFGQGTSAPQTCANADTAITQANLAAAEDAIACLTNLERKKAGLAPLNINATLRGTARAHSQDMVQRRFFSHTNPDKKEPCDRILAAGYPTKCFFDAATNKNLCWTGRCGENIAWNGAATPNNIMYDPQSGWMTHLGPDGTLATNGHRKAILDPQLKDLGVGAAAGNPQGAQGATVTEDFGSPA
jgi:uncharacterized protein YkwD